MLVRLSQNQTLLLGGQAATAAIGSVDVPLFSRFGKFVVSIGADVTDVITEPLPSSVAGISSNWLPLPRTKLAGPDFDKTRKIDVLLNSAVYHHVFRQGICRKRRDMFTLVNTALGWVAGGGMLLAKGCCEIPRYHLSTTSELIERFWKLEEAAAPKALLTEEVKYCEDHFTPTHRRQPDGRFVVKLPFKSTPALGESKMMALKRLRSVKRRGLSDDYVDFMSKYLELGHMLSAIEPPLYYIPHHSVYKNGKIRVMFDASAVSTNGKALNDFLAASPTLQNDLFTILLCFRLFVVAVVCDMVQMYRQIVVDPEDRKY